MKEKDYLPEFTYYATKAENGDGGYGREGRAADNEIELVAGALSSDP